MLVFLHSRVRNCYVWVLVFLPLVVSNSFLLRLDFLCFCVRISYVWGLVILTFGG